MGRAQQFYLAFATPGSVHVGLPQSIVHQVTTKIPLSIIHVVAPAPAGGLETVVRLLATGQQASGHRVVVAVIGDPDGIFTEALSRGGVASERISHGSRSYVAQARALASIFREHRPAVVHTHGYHPDVLGGLVARAAGIPVVTTLHGFTGGDWKNRLYERMQCAAARNARAAVAVSPGVRERLRSGGVASARLHVIPNAYAPSRDMMDRATARRALGVAAEGVRIGWVGRISAEKGPDVLIDALAQSHDPGIQVSMVGDGPSRAATLDRARAAGVDGSITMHGALPSAARLLPAFDLLVLSSRTEGSPVILLEAMAAGVPIVATAVGGVPDMLSEREAFLVPPEDPPALGISIRRALADPHAAGERAQRALERLLSQYALEPWLERYEALYRSAGHPPTS